MAGPWASAAPSTVVRGQTWKHVKRGSTYIIEGLARFQTSLSFPQWEDLLDNAVVVIYCDSVTQQTWVRPLDEFLDGRFEQVNGTWHGVVDPQIGLDEAQRRFEADDVVGYDPNSFVNQQIDDVIAAPLNVEEVMRASWAETAEAARRLRNCLIKVREDLDTGLAVGGEKAERLGLGRMAGRIDRTLRDPATNPGNTP